MNTCKLVRRRKKRPEKEKQGKADNGKDLKPENGSGVESDMDMAMATTIKSDMKREREMETVPEIELGKREAKSKQVGIKKDIMRAEEKIR